MDNSLLHLFLLQPPFVEMERPMLVRIAMEVLAVPTLASS